jgi:hypothetical protein
MKSGWQRNSGLPEFRTINSASRVNPTCNDKPGHDEYGNRQKIFRYWMNPDRSATFS